MAIDLIKSDNKQKCVHSTTTAYMVKLAEMGLKLVKTFLEGRAGKDTGTI